MKTTAIRLYGKKDLRMEEFELPQIKDDEILAKAFARHQLTYPFREVFCHLEAGRCGVPAGIVAIEVDGQIVWDGKQMTEKLADMFCTQLKLFVERQKKEFGLA